MRTRLYSVYTTSGNNIFYLFGDYSSLQNRISPNFDQFWPILANFGYFGPFLGTQSSWK